MPNDDPDVVVSPPPDDKGQGTPRQQQSNDDWEARYKGLQRATEEKRLAAEKERNDLQQQLDDLRTQLEGASSDAKSLEGSKSELQEQVDKLNKQLAVSETEQQKLAGELSRQKVIMDDFPELQSMADFLPKSDDIDSFRETATQFAERLKAQTEAAVKNALRGATPTPRGANEGQVPGQSELDTAYEKVMSLAGMPGKEQEYRTAYDLYVQLTDLQTQQ
jgi:DNA repair exonuclease SbcCD ATPase subunit